MRAALGGTAISGNVTVHGTGLEVVGLPNLTFVRGFYVEENHALKTISLPSLQKVEEKRFKVWHNAELARIEAPALTSIAMDFNVVYNDKLEEMELSSLPKIA